jgi:hypothetical protein
MKKQLRTKLIRERQYLAEVNVELQVTDDEWSPYLTVEDAYKLDGVREALKMETPRLQHGMDACFL